MIYLTFVTGKPGESTVTALLLLLNSQAVVCTELLWKNKALVDARVHKI